VNNLSQKKSTKPKKGGNRRRKRRDDGAVYSKAIPIVGPTGQTEYIRVRMPKVGEKLGIVTQILGADRLQVRCNDGLTRVVRIPGKYRKRLWCRQNDIVSVMPWYGLQEDTRADLVYRYNHNQANWLEKNGYIKLD